MADGTEVEKKPARDDFLVRVAIEQMGTVVGEKTIQLSESFMQRELGVGVSISQFLVGALAKVACPFCQRGRLRLAKVEPLFSRNIFPSRSKAHIGDNYEWSCPECLARFLGSHHWRFMD